MIHFHQKNDELQTLNDHWFCLSLCSKPMKKPNCLETSMKRTFIFFFLCINQITLFARAGGGIGGGGRGGSWGGGGFGRYHGFGSMGRYSGYSPGENDAATALALIGGIFTFGFLLLFLFYFLGERKRTKKTIGKSRKFDAFWNEQNMRDHIRKIFPQIQQAWTDRDLSKISHLTTLDFINSQNSILKDYKRRKLINVVEDISIDRIRITDIHDDEDNSKDKFAAFIQGKMKDYLMPENADRAEYSKNTERVLFEDLYIFRRKADQWKLDKIINNPSGPEMNFY